MEVGFEGTYEINTPNHGVDYADGKQHVVNVWRTGPNARTIHIQV